MRFFSSHTVFTVLLYGIVLLLVFGRTLFLGPRELLFGDDIHRYFFFQVEFARQAIGRGEFPWWNPYQFAGLPFAASPKVAALYPLYWLLVLIDHPAAFSWYVFVHLLIAMTGMYWLARFWMDRRSAWFAGLVWGLSGFFAGRMWAGHIDMIATASWLPLVFGLTWRAMEIGTPRTMILASASIALQYVSGYQTLAFFSWEALGVAAMVQAAVARSMRPILRLAVIFLVGVGLAGVQFLPNGEFVSQSVRTFALPYTWQAIGAFSNQRLWEFIDPFLSGDQHTYFGAWEFYHERIAFFGRVPLVLAIATIVWALITRTRRREVRTLVAIAAIALWLSFGPNAGIDLLKSVTDIIPLYGQIRIPTRHLVLVVFSLALLGGLGLRMIRSRFVHIILIAATVAELILFARHFVEVGPVPYLRHDQELLNAIGGNQLVRFDANFNIGAPPRDSLDFNAPSLYRLFSTTGYETAMLRNYFSFIDGVNKNTEPSITTHDVQVPYLAVGSAYVDFLNMKYVFVPTWLDRLEGIAGNRYVRIGENTSAGWRLYENPTALPRFFLVSDVRLFASRDAVLSAIRAESLDLGQTIALVDSDARAEGAGRSVPCPDMKQATAEVLRYRLNEILLAVQSPCDAWLVSSEVMYPGWRGRVDGRDVSVLEANGAFRAVRIPAGRHVVRLWYDPRIFRLGLSVSALTVLLCALGWRKGIG